MTKEEKYLYDTAQEIIKSLEWQKGFGFSEKLGPSKKTYELIVKIFNKGYELGAKSKEKK